MSSLQTKRAAPNGHGSPCDLSEGLRFGGSELAQVGGHLLGGEGFKQVALLEIAKVGNADTALHSVCDFSGIVFEALQRSDLAFEDLFAVAHHLDLRVAADDTVGDAAAGDGSDLRD